MPHKIPTETHLRTWSSAGDAFGRQDLAKRVVENILTKMDTPNVLGIYGDWGTGKTTFLHYVQMVITGKQKNEKEEETGIKDQELKDFRDKLKREDTNDGDLDKIAVVHFEPWKYEYVEGTDLLLKLIEKIEDSWSTKSESWKELREMIKNISIEFSFENFFKNTIPSIFFIISMAIPSFHWLLSLLQKTFIAIGLSGLTGHLGDFFSFIKMKMKKEAKQEDQFESVGRLFRDAIEGSFKAEEKSKLVIFIDDLDRCLPENTIKLLEAMKNFLFQKNVIFVLALDRLVVSEMIEKKYGLHGGYGIAYLEKLIQYPIILKNPDLVSEVKGIFISHNIDLPQRSVNLIANLLQNHSVPRRAKAILYQFIMCSLIYPGGMTKFFSSLDESHENIDDDLGGVQYAFFAFFLLESFPRIFTKDLNKNWEVISSIKSSLSNNVPLDEKLNLNNEELSRLISIFRDAPIKDAANKLSQVTLRKAMEFILKN